MIQSLLNLDQEIAHHLKPLEGDVRISYANLVVQLEVKGGSDVYSIGTLNQKALKRGQRKWQAIGGAANLTQEGVYEIEDCFDAWDFEVDKKTGQKDARFCLEGHYLPEIAMYLIEAEPHMVEQTPVREFLDEMNSHDVLVTTEELSRCRFKHLGIAIQPPSDSKEDTSARGQSAEVPTRRIFSCWSLIAPEDLVRRIRGADHIRSFTDDLLGLTEEGRCGGILPDGDTIANNLGVPICRMP